MKYRYDEDSISNIGIILMIMADNEGGSLPIESITSTQIVAHNSPTGKTFTPKMDEIIVSIISMIGIGCMSFDPRAGALILTESGMERMRSVESLVYKTDIKSKN